MVVEVVLAAIGDDLDQPAQDVGAGKLDQGLLAGISAGLLIVEGLDAGFRLGVDPFQVLGLGFVLFGHRHGLLLP